MRIQFQKGKQKEFIEKVMVNLGCPSLSELVNRGIETKISSLKNYYSERRTLYDLCEISGFDKNSFSLNFIENNWGQKKGGRKSKRNGPARN